MAEVNKYLTTLEQAWAEHLADKSPDAPTVVSTFAGAGGSSLGYSMAGYRELLAVEWDDNAVETFKMNFPDVPVYHGDITKLTVDECLSMAGLQPGELDVFDGSPPCQGFSTAGKRVMDDPRNSLFREYVRLLRGLRPKVFVMENVSGMVKGKMKLVFAEILKELKSSGYKVSSRLLNAMYFNVPQSRERMIFIGVRDDLGTEPSHPKAEGMPFTVGDAFYRIGGDLSVPILRGKVPLMIPMLSQGQGLSDLTGSYFNWRRLSFSMPSNTLPKSTTFAGFCCLFHPVEDRCIAVPEQKRIGSFPDDFVFLGNFKDMTARIGNSVPPLFMRSIANHIKRNILSVQSALPIA